MTSVLVGKRAKKKRKREKYFLIQKGECWLCKEQMRLTEKLTYLSLTFDHIEPVSLLRQKTALRVGDNLKAAHWMCNMIRGNDTNHNKVTPEQKTAYINNMRPVAKRRMGVKA